MADWGMLASLEAAASSRWTMQEELLAELVELVSALYVAFLHANTEKKNHGRIPASVRIPRPGEKLKRKSWLELARELTGRR